MKYRKDDIFAGRYKLVKHLGTGGFAEVWKAEDIMADNSIVAVKIFAPDKGLDEDGVLVFRREYALTLPLRHNHLLTASYFDINEGSPFLIMPFCEAGSLMGKIVRHYEYSEQEIAEVMGQLTDGLSYLHDNGITHQDLKPDNVMILKPGYYVLADFGISTRIRRSVVRSMRADQAKMYSAFTPAYAPPEKYISKPTPAGDIFSFGVTIYECLTGDVPFEDMGAALERGAKIPDLPEKYSRGLNDLLQKCLATDPSERPTAKEVDKAVKAFIANGIWSLSGNADKQQDIKSSRKPRRTVKMDAEPVVDKTTTEKPVSKTVVARPKEQQSQNSSKPWLIPLLLGSALILSGIAGYNIWSSGNAKKQSRQLAFDKQTYTASFYENMIDSIKSTASLADLSALETFVNSHKDTAELFDDQHFDFTSFNLQFKNRQMSLITMDSLAKEKVRQDSIARAKAVADSLALVEKEKTPPPVTEEPTVTTPSEPDDEATPSLPSLDEIKRRIQAKGHYPRISTSQLFMTNKSAIRTSAYPLLDALAERLKQFDESRVEIGVHSDSQGSSKYNKILTQDRAKAIEKYLIRKGVSSGKITAKGYGEDKPIDTNETPRGRAMNRRVELRPLN